MREFKVYMAGAISGLSYNQATDWRQKASDDLAAVWRTDKEGNYLLDGTGSRIIERPSGIVGYSPMRAKGYLKEMDKMPDHLTDKPSSTIEAILNRDHWDCKTSDAILVNLLGADKVSIGTVLEIGWSYSYRVPLVLVCEEDNIHQHGMITGIASWRTDNLDAGIQMVKDILLP